ncbi:hypothetical protein [Aquimarina sp. 2201CG14-23]|uniref:hypothetical protein n=1 Tax=Aquimarina mycalae TaxID=3040073 RepID=UPI0024780D06|nr:hypothetical protein [Aquimarina sp. 2201CG14-23]MDH7444314.1 hypothetical protein [Aquimarina sp. 2201CG14-23]
MKALKFPLRYAINSNIKIPFLLVWYIFFSNTIKSQNMDEVIEYDSFVIIEKPQKTYKGFYKNGKPYRGYFSSGNKEFPRVDYYENGEAKFQYSLDVYQMALGTDSGEIDEIEESEEEIFNETDYDEYIKNRYKSKLNIKSIYENGSIVDGYEYGDVPSGIFSKRIENQKTTELHIDVFAMHYYQRTSITLRSNMISITSPTLAIAGENLEVRLVKRRKGWKALYTVNDKEIGAKYFIPGNIQEIPANSTLFIYDLNDQTYSYGTSGFQEYSTKSDLIAISNIYFDNPNTFLTQNAQVFFNDLIEAIIQEVQREEEEYLEEPEVYRGYIVTDSIGDRIKGIQFFQKGVHSYCIEYKDGSEVKNEKMDLKKFQEMFKEYLNNSQKD